MKKAEIKKDKHYITNSDLVVQCVDLGEGRFPRTPKFKTVFPYAGQDRLIEPREIRREVNDREIEALKAKSA